MVFTATVCFYILIVMQFVISMSHCFFWQYLALKILKMEPLRLGKNAFPAYSYGNEVS